MAGLAADIDAIMTDLSLQNAGPYNDVPIPSPDAPVPTITVPPNPSPTIGPPGSESSDSDDDESEQDLLKEWSQENPTNEPDPQEINRYNYLKTIMDELRLEIALGVNDPSALQPGELEEYARLFQKYGGDDSDPDVPPPDREYESWPEPEAEAE
jgi:hypothetical protein